MTLKQRDRKGEITTPCPCLPNAKDPIWKKGHQVVELLMNYMSDQKGSIYVR